MTPAMHHRYPRVLTPAESAAITAQCIAVVYPDGWTPVFIHRPPPQLAVVEPDAA